MLEMKALQMEVKEEDENFQFKALAQSSSSF